MTERPPEETLDRDDLDADAHDHEPVPIPEDFENDPSRNPDDERLRDIKGG